VKGRLQDRDIFPPFRHTISATVEDRQRQSVIRDREKSKLLLFCTTMGPIECERQIVEHEKKNQVSLVVSKKRALVRLNFPPESDFLARQKTFFSFFICFSSPATVFPGKIYG
jgi:hypothetical protein